MEFDPNPDKDTYSRLCRLVDKLDHVVHDHVREHGSEQGTNDAFNAVIAVLSGVVQGVADFDPDVFNKLPGAMAYHMYCQAAGSGDRGEYKIQ